MAGSFGGFLKRPSVLGRHFGITAAHCVPGARTGMPVCSPSTLEVTSRLNRLIRYTRFAPKAKRLRGSTNQELEVQGLLENFRFHHCASGVQFLPDPNIDDQVAAGVFSGGTVGTIVTSHFGSHSDILHWYDQELRRHGLPHFSAMVSWLTRLDWSIFTCHIHR